MNALRVLLCVIALAVAPFSQAEPAPVLVGADLEIGHTSSTSDDAILLGMRTAIDEVNAAGGVLGGRPLQLVAMDNRALPARGRENVVKMLAMPDLVAFFAGKFSPVAMDEIDLVNAHRLPMLIPWAAADGLVDNGARPNFVFRLSLNDTLAVQHMLDHARAKGFSRLGLLVPANTWGRSCLAAAEKQDAKLPMLSVVGVQFYYWSGEKSLMRQYAALKNAGVDVILLVANETDGATLVADVASLPQEQRLPIISHWGVAGGRFFELATPGLGQVDFTLVQTRNVSTPRNARARRLAQIGVTSFGVKSPAQIPSVVGLTNSYDLMHLLARAIDKAGSTDRTAIAHALENLGPYDGVLRRYERPFTATRHEALSAEDLGMFRFLSDGRMVPVER